MKGDPPMNENCVRLEGPDIGIQLNLSYFSHLHKSAERMGSPNNPI